MAFAAVTEDFNDAGAAAFGWAAFNAPAAGAACILALGAGAAWRISALFTGLPAGLAVLTATDFVVDFAMDLAACRWLETLRASFLTDADFADTAFAVFADAFFL
jgi:hypothetical protein